MQRKRAERIAEIAIMGAEAEALPRDQFIELLEQVERKLAERRRVAESEFRSPPFLDYNPDRGFSAAGVIRPPTPYRWDTTVPARGTRYR